MFLFHSIPVDPIMFHIGPLTSELIISIRICNLKNDNANNNDEFKDDKKNFFQHSLYILML